MSMGWDDLERLMPRGHWRFPLPPTCRKCGYNLTGLPKDRCPECGTPFKWKEVHLRAGRIWATTLRLRHANQDATLGLILSLSGWFVIGFTRLLGIRLIIQLGGLLALLLAVMAIVLGAQVFNIRRIPHWARSFVSDPAPSQPLGWLVMLLGLTLLAGAVLIPFR